MVGRLHPNWSASKLDERATRMIENAQQFPTAADHFVGLAVSYRAQAHVRKVMD